MAIVTPTDRPKSVRNGCVIEDFGGVFVFSRCVLDFSVRVGAFVIRLSQISSFFSSDRLRAVRLSNCSSPNGAVNRFTDTQPSILRDRCGI